MQQMKVALLTIWHVKNYGAELQTYATVKALRQMGCQVEVIDYRLSDERKKSFLGKIAYIVELVSPLYYKFNQFWKKYIPSSFYYKTSEDLYRNPPKADVYMVGSDQVWNPDITKSRYNSYFLNFGPDSVKRVSYASSFGVGEWQHTDIFDDVKSLLMRFDYITCREDLGVELLNNQFNLKAKSVVDPTLLFDSYPEFAMRSSNGKSLVFYPLSDDPELESLSQKVAAILGLKVINNNNVRKILGRIAWNRSSIEEWVKNIAESQFVITRSFHGLVFSLLYNKQFALLKIRNGRNSRVDNLLKKVGLENRVYETPEALLNDRPWNKSINYKYVNSRMMELREESWGTLKSMLDYER